VKTDCSFIVITMIAQDIRAPLERWFCCCVADSSDLSDDGKWVRRPTRIGKSILFWGKRKSFFPFQCHVGPDWPLSVFTLGSILVVNTVILTVISPIGYIPVILGLIGAAILVVSYCITAFSDPGIVYSNDCDLTDANGALAMNGKDIEAAVIDEKSTLHTPIMQNEDKVSSSSSGTGPGSDKDRPAEESSSLGGGGATDLPPTHIPHSMDCGQCEFKRPYSSRHCDYCGQCIDRLDHHCPWSGKCIGKNNIRAFYVFSSTLCLQVYYLFGCFVYFIIFKTAGAPGGATF